MEGEQPSTQIAMPIIEIDRLDKSSGDAQIKAAVSACIATEMKHGKEQDQAIAMCYSMASEKTGKELGKK